MRKEIKYKLNYREAGEDKFIDIVIDFISNRTLKDYAVISSMAENARFTNNKISDLTSKIAAVKVNKKDGWELEVEKLESEVDDCIEIILEYNNNNYFAKRFDLIKRILTDNKYGDNEQLMSIDFWDDCIDPFDLVDFMATVIYKDIDTKKKQ